jgi:hypothetical protein
METRALGHAIKMQTGKPYEPNKRHGHSKWYFAPIERPARQGWLP